MQWISDKEEFHEIFLEAMTCVFIDSGREDTHLKRLSFDNYNLRTKKFCFLLKSLMEWTNEQSVYFTVLSPDPVDYYQRRFQTYPCIKVEQNDFPDAFLNAINQPLGNEVGEDLSTNYRSFVIAPSSLTWFVHALRSSNDRGGHLWLPAVLRNKVVHEYDIFIEGLEN